MRDLYPEIEPYAVHRFKRGGHQLYVEECGNPSGVPVVFLHGGPGSGCKPDHRRFFHPEKYRIVLWDQRGAGRSLPRGELRHNTTADLLRDLEYIRQQLRIPSWLLFGGSWGATLALLYAEQHPARVLGLVLRGVFLARPQDLDWFVGPGGVRCIYPERWEQLCAGLSEDERADPVAALYRRLTGADELARRRAARDWALWSGQVIFGEAFDPEAGGEHAALVDQARIELHYALHRYFIADNAILDQCQRIARLPTVIVHGRRDLVCPVEGAYRLHRCLPGSLLRILPEAGHIASGPAMIDALVTAADTMVERLGP
ncbi:prolyl aminopeptidase [Candidatus Methylocalor cossyra]